MGIVVNIDFKRMSVAFRERVRLKALNTGSSIVYLQDGHLIEESFADSKKPSVTRILLEKNNESYIS